MNAKETAIVLGLILCMTVGILSDACRPEDSPTNPAPHVDIVSTTEYGG